MKHIFSENYAFLAFLKLKCLIWPFYFFWFWQPCRLTHSHQSIIVKQWPKRVISASWWSKTQPRTQSYKNFRRKKKQNWFLNWQTVYFLKRVIAKLKSSLLSHLFSFQNLIDEKFIHSEIWMSHITWGSDTRRGRLMCSLYARSKVITLFWVLSETMIVYTKIKKFIWLKFFNFRNILA